MADSPKPDVTQLLKQWSGGDREALEHLLPLVYRELHLLAERYLRRERSDHTLQATALVHEAYLKLIDQREVRWQNRAHFFGVAAQAMRRILVDHARGHMAAKRGSGGVKLSLDDENNPPVAVVSSEKAEEMVALDDALNRLAEKDEQQARIVELRFFGGLSIEETAEVLGIGTATVIRKWRVARAFLYDHVAQQK
jgi:RNA polymerase sigma factor (TIGR02999 family)